MERDYIFGTTDRNGLTVENLKTVGDTHTALTCGSFTQVRREYPDCVITDLFRVDEQYGSTEAGGICYDFYAISEHWRNVDKTPALSSLKEASEIAFATLAEAGSIDAVTAGEHKDIFSPWKTGIAYTVGQYRNYGENLYRCIQAHTSQIGWEPDVAVSLWTLAADPAEEWPEWSQPVGAHDAYAAGDKVSHNGKHWTSSVANNVWEPSVYGWEEQA
jgi:hypothetical protein